MSSTAVVDPETDATPSGFPLNRVVALLAPYVAALSGALASWLLVHVHFLGLFHVQHDGLATGIADGLTFALVALMTYASAHHWLSGWQRWESGLQMIEQTKVVAETSAAATADVVPPREGAAAAAREQG